MTAAQQARRAAIERGDLDEADAGEVPAEFILSARGMLYVIAERFGVPVEYLEALPPHRVAEYMAFERVRGALDEHASERVRDRKNERPPRANRAHRPI